MTALERFWAKVEKGTDDCWEWQAGKQSRGYGVFYFDGCSRLAHRFAYAQFVGPIPEGMCVCHHCDNPSCVNPAHLFMGTQADNVRDMDGKGRARRDGGRGERHHLAKLSVEKVLAIRKLRGQKSHREIGRLFGVSKPTIGHVLNKRTWAWVDG